MANSLQQIDIGGTTLWVEVSDLTTAPHSGAGVVPASAAGPSMAAATKVDIGAALQALITPLHDALKSASPVEATVELLLGFAVKGDVIVAKGEANASLKITVKWKFDGASG